MLTLRKWAKEAGMRYETARQWFHNGLLPVQAKQLPSGTIVIDQKRAAPLASHRGDMDQSAANRAFLRIAHERLKDPAGASLKERMANRILFLIEARHAQGLSQTDLDAKAGWADGLAAKYESQTRHPTLEYLETWLQALGLDIQFIEAEPCALTSKSGPGHTSTRAHSQT